MSYQRPNQGRQSSGDSSSSSFLAGFDTFRLIAETQQQVAQISHHATALVKEHYKTPEELAACIESQGTPVYVLPKGHPIHVLMCLIGFEPGFIPPNGSKQFKTLVTCLKLLCPKGHITSEILCVKGFFLLTRPVFTVGYIAHQLHHWLAYSSGLPGYGEMDQSLYKSFWEKHHGVITQRDAEKMDVDEIIRLKNAINRDMEALKFMKNLMQELFTPASQGHNLANGTARA